MKRSNEDFGAVRLLLPQGEATSIRKSKARSLTPALCHILGEVQRELGMNRDAEQSQGAIVGNGIVGNGAVQKLVEQVAERLGFELTNYERDEILTEIEQEDKPFGILQDLVNDPSISDIIVTDYRRISVQQGRRNLSTGLSFSSPEAYEFFVERLLQKAGTTYSTKKPVTDGMLGSFARIHAVHACLCDSGPYLTIRLNRFTTVSTKDLEECGMAPAPIFTYLRSLIRAGKTLLVVGEVGTGKTTLARALASAIPPEEAILVIEDTPEIRLEHPHVRYVTTRERNADGEGRITPHECIRAGMRMAMNRIIFGEIRDAEAAEAFIDVCASGHAGLSTLHARSACEAVARLELFLGRAQRGALRHVLTEQIATALQAIVFVDVCRSTGRRRIMEVREIGPVADGVLRHREMFRYEVSNALPSWRVLARVSAHREVLEQGEQPLILSSLAPELELGTHTLFREVGARR